MKKLSKGAYGGVSGKDYVPYVTDKSKTGGNIVILIIGIILAALFSASTTYSGMKAGLTVAAGIPGAIIGTGAVSLFARKKGILGKNLLQGMSSGGETIASGAIFVLPAILLIGAKLSFFDGFIVGIGGIFFGIGVTALVHNYLIIEEHGKLMYPEAMAISETLVAGDTGGDSLKYMGYGFVIGGVITFLTSSVLSKVNNVVTFVGSAAYKWKIDVEVNPLLLGIGFIVGIKITLTMFAGSLLNSFAIIPLIGYFSDMAKSTAHVWNDPSMPIRGMSADVIFASYAKYIGAGMMLCGGIIGAIKLIPIIISSIKETMRGSSTSGSSKKGISLQTVFLILGVVIAFVAGFIISNGNIKLAIVGAIVSLILMFLFIIVSARLTGTVGTSNLPVSGMTIASLVIITLVFVVMKSTSIAENKTLLLFGTLIVVAISTAGGYSQSQKVTYILGGSKNEMQRHFVIANIVGIIVTVGVMCVLSKQLSVTGAHAEFGLPQANLMAALTSGIMQGNLPWTMIFVGVFMSLVLFFLDLPIMTVAIGFYLPMSTTAIMLIGGLVRVLVEKTSKNTHIKDGKVANGISLSSGLVAGGSIIGLVGAVLKATSVLPGNPEIKGFAGSNSASIILLVILVVLSIAVVLGSKVPKAENED